MNIEDESLEDDEAELIIQSPEVRRRNHHRTGRDSGSPSPSGMKINFRDEGEFRSPSKKPAIVPPLNLSPERIDISSQSPIRKADFLSQKILSQQKNMKIS